MGHGSFLKITFLSHKEQLIYGTTMFKLGKEEKGEGGKKRVFRSDKREREKVLFCS